MVQQKDRLEELDDAPIIDETSVEQVAVEEKMLAEEPASRPEPAVEAPKVEPPVAAAPAPVLPITQTSTPQPELPRERIYSETEFRRMQAAKDREVAEAKRLAQGHLARLQQYDTEAQVEAHLRSQERQLESTLGVDEARRLVRTPENAAQIKENLQNKQQVRALQERELALAAEQELQAKAMTIHLLAQEHGVPADKVRFLQSVNDPYQMVELARHLGQSVRPAQQQVPAETHKTRLEAPDASGGSLENADRRIARLNNVPASNWTDADWEFMRTGRQGN